MSVDTLSGDVGAVRDWIAARFPFVQRIWLYGSRARGNHSPRADIDLAVECVSDTAHNDWLRLASSIDEQAPTYLFVDIVRIDEVQPALKDRIMEEGHLIYERS